MLLKLLGITIATGKDREFGNQTPSLSTGLSTQNNVVAPETMKSKENQKSVNFDDLLHPLTKSIKWPNPEDNPWQKTILRNQIMEFNDSAKNGWFNVCPFTKLKDSFNLILTEEGEFAYRRLRSIHCINFSLMDDEVLQSISTLANLFFTTRKIFDPNGKDIEWVTKL